jgi:hypothetical protein
VLWMSEIRKEGSEIRSLAGEADLIGAGYQVT